MRRKLSETNNVVSLSDHRRRKEELSDQDSLVFRPCGEAWWGLKNGSMCFADNLTVVGWVGTPYCKSCDKPMGTIS